MTDSGVEPEAIRGGGRERGVACWEEEAEDDICSNPDGCIINMIAVAHDSHMQSHWDTC